MFCEFITRKRIKIEGKEKNENHDKVEEEKCNKRVEMNLIMELSEFRFANLLCFPRLDMLNCFQNSKLSLRKKINRSVALSNQIN